MVSVHPRRFSSWHRPRGMCSAIGSGKLVEPNALVRALQVLRDYFAPAALDAVYRDAVNFWRLNRTAQSGDEYLVKSDLPRRKVQTCLHPRGSFPAAPATALCLRKASLPLSGNSLALLRVRGGLGLVEIAQLTRRLFGSMGGGGRQDALYVAEEVLQMAEDVGEMRCAWSVTGCGVPPRRMRILSRGRPTVMPRKNRK